VLVAPVEPVVAVAPAPTRPRPVYDEDAAMRAIEGGWSRRASRALPDAPELIDVSAAVAKAQSAVQQVLVQSGIDPEQVSDRAKPAGTARPRDNSGDDLKHIAGISPLDEQTLNNLGIYRFEQITAWDPTEILWLENHAFARGRIVSEDWQGKARVLLAGRKTA
jgi:NADH-quinone oxidoreductase subunit E